MPMSGVQVCVMTLVMTLVTSRTSPGPRASWSSYSWGLHHQDEQFAESWRWKINFVALLAPLHDSLLETICVVQLMLQCCSLCRMLHRKWLMAGWRLFTLRMRSAVVTRSRHKPQQCHGVKRLMKVTILQWRSSHSHWILHGAVSLQIIWR